MSCLFSHGSALFLHDVYHICKWVVLMFFIYVGSVIYALMLGAAINGLFCCWVCGSRYVCIGLRHWLVPSNIGCLLAQANCNFTWAICLLTFSCLVAQATCSSQELWSYRPLSLSHMMHHCSGLAWLKMNAPVKAMPHLGSFRFVFISWGVTVHLDLLSQCGSSVSRLNFNLFGFAQATCGSSTRLPQVSVYLTWRVDHMTSLVLRKRHVAQVSVCLKWALSQVTCGSLDVRCVCDVGVDRLDEHNSWLSGMQLSFGSRLLK